VRDKNGQAVLHYAAEYNQINIAKLALRNGADLSIADIHGNEPLRAVVFNDKGRCERIEIITLFLAHGTNANHKNKVGKSPKDSNNCRIQES